MRALFLQILLLSLWSMPHAHAANETKSSSAAEELAPTREEPSSETVEPSAETKELPPASEGSSSESPAAPQVESIPDRIDRWMQSVVLLINGPGWCSGVVIDDQGTVATAYHCVASGLRTEVHTRSGERGIAKTTAVKPRDDIALIVVPEFAGKVPALSLREDEPRQGERVFGLGHPFAPFSNRTPAMEDMLTWSVSSGIVSNVGPRLIQTDAALNPGNSGGPVVDESGQIIGITSRKIGGDNVAFLSTASNVDRLIEAPGKPSLLGGTVGLGLSAVFHNDSESYPGLGLSLNTAIRDTLVVNAGLILSGATPSDAVQLGSTWSPVWETTLALRRTLGRGHFSTAIEVGAGFLGSRTLYRTGYDETQKLWRTGSSTHVDSQFFGRFLMGSTAIRVAVVPDRQNNLGGGLYLLALDFGLPTMVVY